MNEKIVCLDIETENTGTDIKDGNKRIISIQIYNDEMEEIYYDDSYDKNIEKGKETIKSLLDDGYVFVGYNLINFDVPLIKKFLHIEIPFSSIIEIIEINKVVELRKNLKKYKLEDVCNEFGVECEHKKLLIPLAEQYKNDIDVIGRAKMEGAKTASTKGWSLEFCRKRALDLISGGLAILDAYNQFVRSNGSTDSIFYKYAIGDVRTEYNLYHKLRTMNKTN